MTSIQNRRTARLATRRLIAAAAALAFALVPQQALSFSMKKGTSARERECLAQAVYFEARGESEKGQKGVAQVVLNRVDSDEYPDTICGVVFQGEHRRTGCQFSFACDGKPDRATEPEAWAKAKAVAGEVLEGRGLVPEIRLATHYHASSVHPYWAPGLKRLSRIGGHVFYK